MLIFILIFAVLLSGNPEISHHRKQSASNTKVNNFSDITPPSPHTITLVLDFIEFYRLNRFLGDSPFVRITNNMYLCFRLVMFSGTPLIYLHPKNKNKK